MDGVVGMVVIVVVEGIPNPTIDEVTTPMLDDVPNLVKSEEKGPIVDEVDAPTIEEIDAPTEDVVATCWLVKGVGVVEGVGGCNISNFLIYFFELKVF